MKVSRSPAGIVFVTIPWLLVLALVIVGHRTVMPPGADGQPRAGAGFSQDTAMAHVEEIAREPHPMGSAQIEQVRAYIIGELNKIGVSVETQVVTAPGYFSTGPVEVVNIIGRIPGKASSSAIALVAHYDTVPETPGANDNSAAVAALVEVARVTVEKPALDNELILLFTDSEEPQPRYGANAFADSPAMDGVRLAVNFEASGGTGAALLVETSGARGWLIDELKASQTPLVAFSFLTDTARMMGDIGTDFDAFRKAGKTGLHFAYLHWSSIYHTDRDNLAAVDPASLSHHGALALGIVDHFGNADLTEPLPAHGDRVFFSIAGRLVSYPEQWTIPLLIIAWLIAGMHLRRAWNNKPAVRRTLIGVLATVALLAIGGLVWLAIATVRSAMGLYEGYVYFALLLAVASAARPRSRDGAFVTALVLAAVTAFVARGFSYLFVWPAIACGLALWIPNRTRLMRSVRFAVVAVTTLVLMVPAIDIFLQFAHPRPGNPDSNIPLTIVVPLGFGLLAAGLVRRFWPAGKAASEPSEEGRSDPSGTRLQLAHTDVPL